VIELTDEQKDALRANLIREKILHEYKADLCELRASEVELRGKQAEVMFQEMILAVKRTNMAVKYSRFLDDWKSQ
jgi:hypothetical protein